MKKTNETSPVTTNVIKKASAISKVIDSFN